MKTWLITGASSGLGKALSEYVILKGDAVVGTSRTRETLESLPFDNSQFKGIVLDLNHPSEMKSAWNEALQQFGSIDYLINNAGSGLLGALEEIDPDQIEKNFRINYFSPLQLIQQAIPYFREQKKGHIISITAIAAFSNDVGFSVYGAAKAALESTSFALSQELKSFGIHISVVAPGPFRTEFLNRSFEAVPRKEGYQPNVGAFENLLKRIQGKQAGDPLKAAQAIYSLTQQEKPPFRLVLGKYAHEKMEKKLKSLQTELDTTKEIGYPTDF